MSYGTQFNLRPPVIEDLNSYHNIFSDKETHHFIIDEGVQDYEGSKNKLNFLINHNGNSKIVYTIIDGSYSAGFIVIHIDGSKIPFVSYAVQRSSWGKGFATKALQKLIDFEGKNFDGFKAATHLDNLASQHLLRKIGFVEMSLKKLKMGERMFFECSFGS